MSTWERLADLPLELESYCVEGLSRTVSSNFERQTTVVRFRGAGLEGIGEDVTYESGDQVVLQRAGAVLRLAGRFTLASFASRLDELDLFPEPAQREVSRDYRRWAFEAAALDLALRQAGRTLGQQLEIEPRPIRFVVSMGGVRKPAGVAPLVRWRELYPELRFKLDAGESWDDELVRDLAELDAVDVVDLKGAYVGTPVDTPANPALYARVARMLPAAWIEDPALTPEADEVLRPFRDRVTWDAPIHSVDDILALPYAPRTLNMKPSRCASLRRLFDAYDYCADREISLYGGGQFELGPGRGQIQHLVSSFHPDGPNDVAPTGYNDPEPRAGLPTSPLAPPAEPRGFRRDDT